MSACAHLAIVTTCLEYVSGPRSSIPAVVPNPRTERVVTNSLSQGRAHRGTRGSERWLAGNPPVQTWRRAQGWSGKREEGMPFTSVQIESIQSQHTRYRNVGGHRPLTDCLQVPTWLHGTQSGLRRSRTRQPRRLVEPVDFRRSPNDWRGSVDLPSSESRGPDRSVSRTGRRMLELFLGRP